MTKRWLLGVSVGAMLIAACGAYAHDLAIVAAENFYGDVARQIVDGTTSVRDVLNNPAADPHLFEANPSTARALASADVVIYNGANYDPWMARLLAAAPTPARRAIVAAELLHRESPGVNPHLWYDPLTMPAVARAITMTMQRIDGAHQADYQQHLNLFLHSLAPLDAKIAELRQRFAGVAVAATEPVSADLIAALGLQMLEQRFQLSTMNDTEPSFSDTAQFERDLRSRRVRVLIYNPQTSNTAVTRLLRIAAQWKVPVVSMSETEPAGMNYQQWMLAQLSALERALSGQS